MPPNIIFRLHAKVWLYPGMAAWHFLTLPKKESDEIKAMSGPRRGWGSVRVEVTMGKTTWKTSIFPDKKSACYLLPIKADVRKKEKIQAGDDIVFQLVVVRT